MPIRWADEQGSIMPVFVGLLGLVFLILTLVVDRAWVRYNLELARQTADFAAEAAAGPEARTVWSTVTVNRAKWVTVTSPTPVCTDPGPDTPMEDCLDFVFPTTAEKVSDTTTQDGPQSDFQGDWRSLFDCAPGQEWTCESYTIAEEVRFHSDAADIARQVFLGNWDDGSSVSARVTQVQIPTNGTSRMTAVSLDLRIRSLFGWFATDAIPVTGRAVIQYQPLVLN